MLNRLFFKLISPVSFKVTLAVVIPTGIIMAFFAYHHYQHNRQDIFTKAETQLLTIGEDVKGRGERFMKNEERSGLQDMVMDAMRDEDIGQIVFIDQKEGIIACSKKAWIGKTLQDMHPGDMSDMDVRAVRMALLGELTKYYDPEDHQYCLIMPLSYAGNNTVALHIALNMNTSQAAIKKDAIENIGIVILIIVLMGMTIYFIFFHLFASRIRSVSVAANSVLSGELTARAEEKGKDEISELAISFNKMADGISIWRNNMEEVAANQMKDLLVLFEVVNTVSQSLEMGTVLPKVLELVTDNMGVTEGAIVLVGNDGRTLSLLAQRGLADESIRQITQYGMGGIGDVILRKKSIRVGGGEEGSVAIPGLEQNNVMAALIVPISTRGTIVGVLAVYSEKQDQFTDQDESLLATIGNQLSVAVLNARLYEETLSLAQIDGLTGMANRRYLMVRLKQELDRAERYQTSLSVIMLDLDKFKTFNDTYGHLKGDELLKAFSAMVKEMIRTTDLAGRYGGEEFCVMLPNTSIKGALVIAERIRKSAEELKIPIDDNQPPVGRTVSIGVAEYSIGDSIEKMLSTADAALYRAKEGGRNRVVS